MRRERSTRTDHELRLAASGFGDRHDVERQCSDRDLNAAVNLARWGESHTCAGETSPVEAGTDVHTAPAA